MDEDTFTARKLNLENSISSEENIGSQVSLSRQKNKFIELGKK